MAGDAELHEPIVVDGVVHDRGDELIVREDRALPAELHVRGEHDAPPLVAVRYNLAEQACAVHVEGHVVDSSRTIRTALPTSASSQSSVPSHLAFPSCSTSVAVWKKRAGISRRVASMPMAMATCVLPRPFGPWKTRPSACPTNSSESISAAPALGEAHVGPVEAHDSLGHRKPRLAQQLARLERSRDSSSRVSVHERAASWPGGRGIEEPRHLALDTSSDLEREESFSGSASGILGTGCAPSSSSKARSYPAKAITALRRNLFVPSRRPET